MQFYFNLGVNQTEEVSLNYEITHFVVFSSVARCRRRVQKHQIPQAEKAEGKIGV
jgi:hypothetical protein